MDPVGHDLKGAGPGENLVPDAAGAPADGQVDDEAGELEQQSEHEQLQGEAGGVAEELCPAIPWPQLRAIGNLLRHEYDRIDAVRVWLTIEDDLAPL